MSCDSHAQGQQAFRACSSLLRGALWERMSPCPFEPSALLPLMCEIGEAASLRTPRATRLAKPSHLRGTLRMVAAAAASLPAQCSSPATSRLK